MNLMIYEWHDELGELPCARLKATGELKSLDQLMQGDLIEFSGVREIFICGEVNPVVAIDTIRRAKDGVGIELVNRGQAGRNQQGEPFHTIYPLDIFEGPVTKYKGYPTLHKLLKRYGL